MKAITKYLMMIAMLAMSVGFSSCDPDVPDDPPIEPSLAGTLWAYTETADVSGIAVTYDYTISFSATSAVYKIQITEKKGNASYTNYETINYSYTLSESGDLVVFTPQESGKAYLEGDIESDIKMTLTNVSTNKVIGVFYKQ